MNTPQSDEQWLDNLLAHSPSLRDNGFSDNAWQGIKQYQQRRRMIFVGAWFVALVIVVLSSPWAELQQWLGVVESSDMSLLAHIKTALTQFDRDQLMAQVRDNWGIVFALLAIVVVFIKNLLMSEV